MDNNNFNENQYNTSYSNGQIPYNQVQLGKEVDAVVSTGEWMLTMLVLSIPCVNIIMLFVWAFGNGNKNTRNFSRACLLWMVIMTAIVIIFYVIIGAAILAGASSGSY